MTAVKIRVVILGPLVTLRLLSPALEKIVLPPAPAEIRCFLLLRLSGG